MEYIDYEAFEKRTMNDVGFQQEFLGLSATLFEQYHDQMSEAAEKKEYVIIKGLAHKAKTGAALMGMDNVSAEYQKLENEILVDHYDPMMIVRIEAIRNAFNNCIVLLKQYINSKNK